jgi:outer membrane receptor protein involved in Fe transport
VDSIRRSVRVILFSAVLGAPVQPLLAAQAGADASAQDTILEEIVVTATRHSDTVNRVALAVTAQTQDALDQRGILDLSDLEAVVPGLRISGREASGNVTVAIRGIRQQAATAATTGFYVDETSLQKRAAGSFASQNGTPVPPLFDLERVEVLRGPQGTLFGGGSEGGTIRYIQARPSLTEYSAYGRAQWMSTRGGDPGYEAGFAVGGPILEGKLGFRASVFKRDTGGYIDLTDFRDGEVYDEDANSSQVRMGRVALTWAPTDSTELTLSFLKSIDETDHLGSSYNLSEPGQLVVDPLCFNIPYILSLPVPARAFLVPPAVLPVNPGCNAGTGAYVAPGYTVGPFELDRFQSLALGQTPTRSDMQIGSAIFHWNLSNELTLTSVSSFTQDLSRGQSPQNFPVTLFVHPGTAHIVVPGQPEVSVPTGSGFNPNITSVPNGLGLGALIRTNTNNRRNVFSQEVRLASAPERRVSYVVGGYFSNARARVLQYAETSDLGFQQLSGMTIEQRYGVPFNGFFSNIFESIQDVEQAAFGDVTVRLTDQWRLSAGARVTYVTTSFTQSNYGPNGGTSSAAQSQISGQISETPVTPKVSLQYFITPTTLAYATAAKGFRAGGVNQVLTSAADGSLAQYGLTTAVLPRTYASDSVWSYELGGKTGFWDGRAQLNAAIYDLEWKNAQAFLFLGDGAVFNVPTARSRGVEVEGQLRPVQPLTLNAAVTRTEAKYTSSLIIPGGPGSRAGDLTIAQDGQKFAQPAWTVDFGARYDFAIGAQTKAYARIDYRWFDGYLTAVPGTAQYSPDSSRIPAQKSINLRLGFEWQAFDVSLFALNATDEKKGSQGGGRSQCTNADCSTYNSYGYGRTLNAPTPRQIGLQVAYKP